MPRHCRAAGPNQNKALVKRSAIFFGAIGLALAFTLLVQNDLKEIGRTLVGVGWGILLIAALHLPQTLFAVLGWQALSSKPRPTLWALYRIRWVRDSINTLLPVAKLGGDFVRVQLLSRRGVAPAVAASGMIVDVSLEVATQVAFTLGAVLLLLAGSRGRDASELALGACASGAIVVAALFGAQRLGALKLIERLAARGGAWRKLEILSGLHAQVNALYRQPKRILLSAAFHFTAWFLGTFETYAALVLLGLHATVREAVIIEALGHAVRAAGFAIPGAMGVQEGGYLVICGIFGIASPQALALALIHRIRELILGVPGLLLWQRRKRPGASGDPATDVSSGAG
jgi:putative membrane protein